MGNSVIRIRNLYVIRIVCCIFVLVGLVVMGWGIKRSFDAYMFKKKASVTEGTIVSYTKHYDKEEGTTTFAPIYEYTVDGVLYTFTDHVSTNSIPKEGSKADLYYMPDNPEDIMTDKDQMANYFMMGMGLLFATTGAVAVLNFYKTPKGKMAYLFLLAFTFSVIGIGGTIFSIMLKIIGSTVFFILFAAAGFFLLYKAVEFARAVNNG